MTFDQLIDFAYMGVLRYADESQFENLSLDVSDFWDHMPSVVLDMELSVLSQEMADFWDGLKEREEI